MPGVPPLSFDVRITFDADEGLWYADCIDLQGCHTFGATKEEAFERIHEVIGDRLWAGAVRAKQETADAAGRRGLDWQSRPSTETVRISAA